jgi:hypothetical protein
MCGEPTMVDIFVASVGVAAFRRTALFSRYPGLSTNDPPGTGLEHSDDVVTHFCGRASWSRRTRWFRSLALALVTLALLPFTHPFPTCSVSTFFEEHYTRHATRTSPATTIDAAVRRAGEQGAVLAEGEFKEDFAIAPASFALHFTSLEHAPRVSGVLTTPRRPIVPALRL